MDDASPSRTAFLKARRLWRNYLEEDREIHTISAASIPELIGKIDAIVPRIISEGSIEIDKYLSKLSTGPVELSIVFCDPIEGSALNWEGGHRRDVISQGFNPVYHDGEWRQSVRIQIMDPEKHWNPKPIE